MLWRVSKFDLFCLLVAFIVTTLAGVQIGIVTAIGVSILSTVLTTSRPYTAILGRVPGSVVYKSVRKCVFPLLLLWPSLSVCFSL